MGISVRIDLDISGISNKALRNALSGRIAQIQQEAQEKKKQIIKEELQTAYDRRTVVANTDISAGARKIFDPSKSPKISLEEYLESTAGGSTGSQGGTVGRRLNPATSINSIIFRKDEAPWQGRLRAYISNAGGTAFRELDFDWMYVGESPYINGDPDQAQDEDIGSPEDYLSSVSPVDVNVLCSLDDFAISTSLSPTNVIAGYNNRVRSCRKLGNWIYNPRYQGLAVTNTGPFCQIQRCLYLDNESYGGVRCVILPFVEDTCIVVVFAETIVKRRAIDFYRVKTGGGTVAANTTRNIVVPNAWYYAREIIGAEGASVPIRPKWEWLVGRIPEGLGQIDYIRARMTPRTLEASNLGNGGTISPENWDQSHMITFQLMAGGNFKSHYSQYYARKNNLAGQATSKIKHNEVWPDLCPGREITGIIWASTDPNDTLPVGEPLNTPDPCGLGLDRSIRGWDTSDNFTFNIYNEETGGTTSRRTYRSRAMTWVNIEDGEPAALGQEETTFGELVPGDYLWVRVHEVKHNWKEESYCAVQHGTNRITPVPPETGAETGWTIESGGYAGPQDHLCENLFIDIYLKDGTSLSVDSSGNVTNHVEYPEVAVDSEVITDYRTVSGDTMRSFIVNRNKILEITTPEFLIGSADLLFSRLDTLSEDSYNGAEIQEYEVGDISFAYHGNPLWTYHYGPIPGKNRLPDAHLDLLLKWGSYSQPDPGEGTTTSEPYSLTYPGAQSPVGFSTQGVDGLSGPAPGPGVDAYFPPPPRRSRVTWPNPPWAHYATWIESPKLTNFDYRTGNSLVLNETYTFSIYVYVASTGYRDDGIYPAAYYECKQLTKAKFALCHTTERDMNFPRVHEYSVWEVEIGEWTRVSLTFKAIGKDAIRLDNWDGDNLSELYFSFDSPQIEEGTSVSDFQVRGEYLQSFANGTYSDQLAKGNAVGTIGMFTQGYGYDPNAWPLFGVPLEGNVVNEIIAPPGGVNIYSPVEYTSGANSNVGQAGAFSPTIYNELDPDRQPSNGSGELEGQACSYSAPNYYIGYSADRTLSQAIDASTQEGDNYWTSINSMINTPVETRYVDANGSCLSQTNTNENGQIGASTCSSIGSSYGDFDNSENYDFDRSLNNDNCSSLYYGVDVQYTDEDGVTGTYTGLRDVDPGQNCTFNIGYGSDGGNAGGYSGNQPNEERDENNGESEPDECELIIDKAERQKGFLRNCGYHFSELFQRADYYAQPGILTYTDFNDPQGNAEALGKLGFDVEGILGIIAAELD